jgi:hypothetical protein
MQLPSSLGNLRAFKRLYLQGGNRELYRPVFLEQIPALEELTLNDSILLSERDNLRLKNIYEKGVEVKFI